MRAVLSCLLWTLLVTFLTVGLAILGFILDPWDGEIGGNHWLIFVGFPFFIGFIGISAFDLPPNFEIITGALVGFVLQFMICLVPVATAQAFLTLLRKVNHHDGSDG